VVAAFDLVMDLDDSTGLYEDSRRALAAALREVAAVMGRKVRSGGYILPGRVLTEKDILAIADNIEQAITYAENQSNGH
jgi:hypothetical protein